MLAAIRDKNPSKVIPAIAISAFSRLDDRSRSDAAGFQACVAKPVDPEALVMALRRVMVSTT